jgi:hypothetical protein
MTCKPALLWLSLWRLNVISALNCTAAVRWFWLSYEIVKFPNALVYFKSKLIERFCLFGYNPGQ